MDKSGQVEEAGEEGKKERVLQERKPTRSRERSTSREGSVPKEVIHTDFLKTTFRSTGLNEDKHPKY